MTQSNKCMRMKHMETEKQKIHNDLSLYLFGKDEDYFKKLELKYGEDLVDNWKIWCVYLSRHFISPKDAISKGYNKIKPLR